LSAASTLSPYTLSTEEPPIRRSLPRDYALSPRAPTRALCRRWPNLHSARARPAKRRLSSPRFPCMGFVKEAFQGATVSASFPSSVSLFDLRARFFVPTRTSLALARAEAVRVGGRADLAACSELARPYLDSFEHDGTLGAIGMTIRGEPACGRGSVAPQPCIRWVQGPEP
jgi:hypothetical protein